MSLLFDQNLSRRLPTLLAVEFPGSEQVFSAGLGHCGRPSGRSVRGAQGLAMVSKDADFAALSATLGLSLKIVCLRIGNGPTRDQVVPEMRVGQLVAAIGEVCADLHGRGLWDAANEEFLEAVWQIRRNFAGATASLAANDRTGR